MNKNMFHVFYVAVSVFVAVFVMAIYMRPLIAGPLRPAPAAARRETTILVEPKYIYVPQKEHACTDAPPKY